MFESHLRFNSALENDTTPASDTSVCDQMEARIRDRPGKETFYSIAKLRTRFSPIFSYRRAMTAFYDIRMNNSLPFPIRAARAEGQRPSNIAGAHKT